MANDERAAIVAQINDLIEVANRLIPLVQRIRFPLAKHPPMLFHWDDEWDDLPLSDLLDVFAWINGIVGRLEGYQ